jgi:hypothetical protein
VVVIYGIKWARTSVELRALTGSIDEQAGAPGALHQDDATPQSGELAAREGLKEFVWSRTGNECYPALGCRGDSGGLFRDKQLASGASAAETNAGGAVGGRGSCFTGGTRCEVQFTGMSLGQGWRMRALGLEVGLGAGRCDGV